MPRSKKEILKDYWSLTKPRLSAVVLLTTAGGMWLPTQPLSLWTVLCATFGTAGTIGAANAFNCIIERNSDRLMRRTAGRPLPAQRMTVQPAIIFATLLAGIALPTLALGVNLLTAMLGLLALCMYVFVYTPLKPRTHFAMMVGAIPGALPPLMGWTATTGKISLPGVLLFCMMFLWQLPHSIAIALFRSDDYQAAGLKSLPLEHGVDRAKRYTMLYVIALVPISLLFTFVGVVGWLYFAVALVLNVWLLWISSQGWRSKDTTRWAYKLFATSLFYITGLFAALTASRIFNI